MFWDYFDKQIKNIKNYKNKNEASFTKNVTDFLSLIPKKIFSFFKFGVMNPLILAKYFVYVALFIMVFALCNVAL